jgi:hypothetical protein
MDLVSHCEHRMGEKKEVKIILKEMELPVMQITDRKF